MRELVGEFGQAFVGDRGRRRAKRQKRLGSAGCCSPQVSFVRHVATLRGRGLARERWPSEARGCSDERGFPAEAARAVRRGLCFYALSTVPVDVRLPSICARSMDQNRPTAALQIGSTALRVWTAVSKTSVSANVQYTRP